MRAKGSDPSICDALHHLAAYRGDIPPEEPLPFGVYAAVIEPGTISLGDPVSA